MNKILLKDIPLKQLVIYFKNDDTITIDAKNITNLMINGITYNGMFVCQTLKKFIKAEEITFGINKNADKPYSSKDISISAKTTFERIFKQTDISRIDLIYDDNTTETIYAIWHDANRHTNLYQHMGLDMDGNLLANISNGIYAVKENKDPYPENPTIVLVSYSFDDTTEAYAFDSMIDAMYYIHDDYHNEYKYDKESNKNVLENDSYCKSNSACLSYKDNNGEIVKTYWKAIEISNPKKYNSNNTNERS